MSKWIYILIAAAVFIFPYKTCAQQNIISLTLGEEATFINSVSNEEVTIEFKGANPQNFNGRFFNKVNCFFEIDGTAFMVSSEFPIEQNAIAFYCVSDDNQIKMILETSKEYRLKNKTIKIATPNTDYPRLEVFRENLIRIEDCAGIITPPENHYGRVWITSVWQPWKTYSLDLAYAGQTGSCRRWENTAWLPEVGLWMTLDVKLFSSDNSYYYYVYGQPRLFAKLALPTIFKR